MAVGDPGVVPPRGERQDEMGAPQRGSTARTAAAAAAGLCLVVAAVMVGVRASPVEMLSWQPAVENPMAAAALGNRAASTAENHFSLKKMDRRMLRAPAAGAGGWVAGQTRREARAIQMKAEQQQARPHEQQQIQEEGGAGADAIHSQYSGCATWSSYCAQHVAKLWNERRRGHVFPAAEAAAKPVGSKLGWP
eukprot:CAMPEP_0169483750 /NCGR_PEP_ID=MMETSP1042-20121227/31380_1 /TAXON_ID=464988 /ORGANISM="Hemiselmis andersenii, Strain CCMP1180" /LENGTH=192 /DNA_ID=CAMNT_0009598715 /DNA_START=63 /DNA_END=637 /DNA_ORIENTATION=-